MNPADIGARIGGIRERFRMTQAQLGQQLGIPRTAVVALEAGQRGLRAAELYRLAEVFQKPLGYFLTHGPSREVDMQPLYRLFTTDSGSAVAENGAAYQRAKDGAVRTLDRFQDLCADWVQLQELGAVEPGPPIHAPETAKGMAPAGLAAWVRAQLGSHEDAPLVGLRHSLERVFEVLCFVLDRCESALSGASIHDPAAGRCVLLTRSNHGHMRFTLAHELAHLLAHSAKPHIHGTHEHHQVQSQERFADQFAAALLMPAQGLRRTATGLAPLDDPLNVLQLAGRFGVSFAAMGVRLETLKLLPRGWRKQATLKMKSKGHGPEQFAAHAAPPPQFTDCPEDWGELPSVYKRLALEAVYQGKISTQKYAHFLRTDLARAQDILDEIIKEIGVFDEPATP